MDDQETTSSVLNITLLSYMILLSFLFPLAIHPIFYVIFLPYILSAIFCICLILSKHEYMRQDNKFFTFIYKFREDYIGGIN